ncbi:MAG: hypothetical protein ACK4SZ_09040 [Allosphingosinicella sp.]|uniref:hypothetical protein n=1 Tax=Allosphingosinicella sp. TaxID=2823234 RepID=UPI0039630702
MSRRVLLILPICAGVAACGPNIEAETIANRVVMLTNAEDEPITIQKIVANDRPGRAECVDTPGAQLGPGRTYTKTFFYCDELTEVDVETDRGSVTIDLN